MTVTIGTDVEFFLGQQGKFVPAYGLIPGTKHDPFPVIDGAVQVDGVAAEVNTLPTTSFHEFKSNLALVLNQLQDMVPSYEFIQDTTVTIDFSTTPAECLVLGCDPDFDPYDEEMNVCGVADAPYRSAGGHIHIGGIFTDNMTSTDRYKTAIRLARLLDKYVGVYSLLWDKDTTRRKTYGRAGNCRLKDYGVEYRCLSNAWLFNEQVMEFIYNQIHKAVQALRDGEDVTTWYRDIINTNDTSNAFFDFDSTAQKVKEMVSV